MHHQESHERGKETTDLHHQDADLLRLSLVYRQTQDEPGGHRELSRGEIASIGLPIKYPQATGGAEQDQSEVEGRRADRYSAESQGAYPEDLEEPGEDGTPRRPITGQPGQEPTQNGRIEK